MSSIPFPENSKDECPADFASSTDRFLTDQQWHQLSKLSTLGDQCRDEIENLCSMAKAFYEADSAEWQRKRKGLIREAADISNRLAEIVPKIRQMNLVWTEWDEEFESKLLPLLNRYARDAKARVSRFRTGPTSDGFKYIISSLNFTLLAEAKRPLSLAKKGKDGFDPVEFAVEVFEFGGVPNKGPGLRTKVHNSIKALVDEMAHWAPEFRPALDTAPRDDIGDNDLGWMFKR